MRRAPVLLATFVLASPAMAAVEIVHAPVTCVAVDRYARVTASATPAEGAARAELQFRAPGGGGWYSILMAPAGGSWSALLPRPVRPLSQLEYRVVVAGKDLAAAETPVQTVRIVNDPAECAGAGAVASVAGPIVIRVPPGAPVVPPVPAGFSPAGVVAAAPPARQKSKIAGLVAGGLAIAGGAAAVSTASDTNPPPIAGDIPTFRFNGTRPNPGATLLVGVHDLYVMVRMDHEPAVPFNFYWQIEFFGAGINGGRCSVFMTGVFQGAQRPLDLALSSLPSFQGFCGPEVAAEQARITITIGEQVHYTELLNLPYTFRR